VSAERRNLPAVVEAVAPAKASSLRSTLAVPAVIADAGDHATRRFLEFALKQRERMGKYAELVEEARPGAEEHVVKYSVPGGRTLARVATKKFGVHGLDNWKL